MTEWPYGCEDEIAYERYLEAREELARDRAAEDEENEERDDAEDR